jgi:membrane protein implicated in regulation of membrane protease activity
VVTTDQVILAAIGTVIVILVIAGIVRAMGRRQAPQTGFGAGGTATVPLGTRGIAKTAIARTGVVLAAGEEWTASARDGAEIAPGQQVVVVGQDGLTIIVEPGTPGSGTQG